MEYKAAYSIEQSSTSVYSDSGHLMCNVLPCA